MKTFHITIVCCSLAACACLAAISQTTSTLSGKVSGVPNTTRITIKLACNNEKLITAYSGDSAIYHIPNIKGDTCVAYFTADGYNPLAQTVYFGEGQQLQLDMALVRKGK